MENATFLVSGKLLIENANIMRGSFRNFSGKKEGRYDQPGKRYFNLQIESPDLAGQLASNNWPVKILAPRDPMDAPQHIMKVSVKPENRYFPCHIRMVSNGVLTTLDPDDYELLDTAEIVGGDLTLRIWEYNPGEFSAQLEEGIFTIQPLSYWEEKYASEEYPHE